MLNILQHFIEPNYKLKLNQIKLTIYLQIKTFIHFDCVFYSIKFLQL